MDSSTQAVAHCENVREDSQVAERQRLGVAGEDSQDAERQRPGVAGEDSLEAEGQRIAMMVSDVLLSLKSYR